MLRHLFDVDLGRVFFPTPDKGIFRIEHLPGFSKSAFLKDARGSIHFRKGVRANGSDPGVARSEFEERFGDFGGETFPLITRRDAVSDFGDAIGWRTGKTGHAD